MQTQSSANMDKEVLDTWYGLMLRKSSKHRCTRGTNKIKKKC